MRTFEFGQTVRGIRYAHDPRHEVGVREDRTAVVEPLDPQHVERRDGLLRAEFSP